MKTVERAYVVCPCGATKRIEYDSTCVPLAPVKVEGFSYVRPVRNRKPHETHQFEGLCDDCRYMD